MRKIFRNKKAQKTEAAETVAIVGLKSVIIEKIHEDAVIPVYATDGDSGMDVYAVEDMVLVPGANNIAKLGFKMEIPRHPLHDLGYRWECQARPRSGISAMTFIRVSNAPGTIDNFFRGEVGIILSNIADKTNFINQVPYVRDLKGNIIELKDLGIGPAVTTIADFSYLVRKGDKIAQLVFNEVARPTEIIEGKVSNENSRGGGFGHSGINDNDNVAK